MKEFCKASIATLLAFILLLGPVLSVPATTLAAAGDQAVTAGQAASDHDAVPTDTAAPTTTGDTLPADSIAAPAAPAASTDPSQPADQGARKNDKSKEAKASPDPKKSTPAATPGSETPMVQAQTVGDGVTANSLVPRPIDPYKQIADLTGKQSVNEFSGNFEYSYPITLPPGRNGLTPELSLSYNSSDRNADSPVGYGWELSIPKIERFSRTGAENLYWPNNNASQPKMHNFTSPFAGGNSELLSDTIDANEYGTYVPKVVSGQYKHEFLSNNTWKVTDGKGTVYIFGSGANDRIEGDYNGTFMINSWYLSSVTDMNGNVIAYEYKKVGGNVYPSRIRWGNEATPFEVRFEPYYSGTIQAPDVLPSKNRGFDVIEKLDLLDRIDIVAPNGDTLQYELTYAPKITNPIGLPLIDYLQQIRKKGTVGGQQTTDNPTVFQYASYDGSRSIPVQKPELVTGQSMYAYLPSAPDLVQWTYGDYNGDGWVDLVKDWFAVTDSPNTAVKTEEAYLNQGNGTWTHTVNPNPDNFWWTMTYGTNWTTSPMFIDFDGNGRATACRKDLYTVQQQFIYPGTFAGSLNCAAGENLTSGGTSGLGIQLFDVNGDGLLDEFDPFDNTDVWGQGYTYVNSGTALNINPTWSFSSGTKLNYYPYAALTGDINGDGLDDVIYWQQVHATNGAVTNTSKIMLSTPRGWVDATAAGINMPIPTLNQVCTFYGCGIDKTQNTYAHLVDVNRDGLPDLIYGKGHAYLNTGKGWSNTETTISTWAGNLNVSENAVDSHWDNQFYDVNNDGILERYRHGMNDGDYGYFPNDSFEPPIMTGVTTPLNAAIAVEYTPASAYKNPDGTAANFDLPVPHLTVSKLTVSGGQLPTSVTTYSYAGGKLYRPNIVKGIQKQEMLGFQTVIRTDPNNSKTMTEFFQGLDTQNFAGKGSPVRQTVTGADGKLLAEIRKAYSVAERLTGKSYESLLSKTLSIAFNPDNVAENKATGKDFQYDAYGNVTLTNDYGEVTPVTGQPDFTDTGADKLTTTTEYALNTGLHILSLPKHSLTTDQNNVTVGEQKLSYDGLAYGSAPIEGNLTRSETLRSAGQYVTTQTAYNSYGLPISITNARNYTTTITYDSLNLYPATVTNSKNHVVSYAYNYLFGTPALSTDPNGFKTQYTYDGLGRLTKTEVSDPSSPAQFVTQATYAYDLTAAPVSVTSTSFPNNNDVNNTPIQITAKTYLDGLGRIIQVRTEWEGDNNYLVTGSVYDNRDNIRKTLLPQFGAGIAFDTSFNETKPGSANTYDALNRVTSTVTPYGAGSATTTIGYDRWSKVVTDARGFKKDFIADARGNLIQVKEYLTAGTGASPAGTTTYIYDALKNLTKITDASGNIKNLTYDLLGHKLTEEDFHTPADTTFSHWSYTYDNNGNQTSIIDAKNQTTNYTYDELDRPLTEDFTGQAGTEVTYAYDTAPNGKGRPASSTTVANSVPVITKTFEYDLLGNVTKETRTINGVNYITQTEYDLAGNPKRIIYPDAGHTEELSFYNNAGQLEKVQKKQGTTTADLVTNFDYAETGAPKTIVYANGVTTTNTYDITYLYYLTRKQTVKGTTKLQDISYSFDPTGNITQITDASQTDAAKTVAYTYDGLSRLTGATATNAANGQNYTQTFAYDIIGNITNKSDVGAYTYAQTNNASPHAVTGAGGKTYAYDNNGNLTGDGTWTHAFDYKDRLLSSAKTGANIIYIYDEGGTRVTKRNTTSGKTTTYVNDLLDIEAGTEKLSFYARDLKLATLEGTGASSGTECSIPASGDWTIIANCTISSFKTAPGNVTINAGIILTIAHTGVLEINLNSKKLLVKSTAKVFVQQGGAIAQTGRLIQPQGGQQSTLIFHHADHLSGASVDSDTAGNVLQLTDYYPYGDSRIESTTTAFHNDYTYTGKERDEDTTLLYYEARYYDSQIGRFISLDPWKGDAKDPQSLNKYSYVRNNPLKYTDPQGKNRLTELIIPPAYAPADEGQSGDIDDLHAQVQCSYYDDLPSYIPGLSSVDSASILLTGKGLGGQEYSSEERLGQVALGAIPFGKDAKGIAKAVGENDDLVKKEIVKQIKTLEGSIKKNQATIEEHLTKMKQLVEGTYKMEQNKVKGNYQQYKQGLLKTWSVTISRSRGDIQAKTQAISNLVSRLTGN